MNDDELRAWLDDNGTAPRRQFAALSRMMDDELQVDAWLHNRPVATQGTVLLQKALKDRVAYRREMLETVAKDKGIEPDKLRRFILSGQIPPLTEEERAAIAEIAEERRSRGDKE